MPSLIVKKEEKIEAVFNALRDNSSEEAFITKFKEMYPKDWSKIQAEYAREERKTKPGKTHPMPHPDVYMKNMYKVAIQKRKQMVSESVGEE